MPWFWPSTCLMMRAIGVMALPIFGDEAIYLRWAQLIRGEGVVGGGAGGGQLWISLADPKPPLHYWLMASVLNWTVDPLVAARWISVLSGVLGIPLAMLIGNECGFLIRVPETTAGQAVTPTGRTLGLMAALLMVFCPFLSFYQRLATADALFVCESLAIVWLSLRWGRLAANKVNSGSGRAVWGAAVVLGIAIGIGLMTRQGISYTLCAMPVVVVAGAITRHRENPGRVASRLLPRSDRPDHDDPRWYTDHSCNCAWPR